MEGKWIAKCGFGMAELKKKLACYLVQWNTATHVTGATEANAAMTNIIHFHSFVCDAQVPWLTLQIVTILDIGVDSMMLVVAVVCCIMAGASVKGTQHLGLDTWN